jgi:hypothetical protein
MLAMWIPDFSCRSLRSPRIAESPQVSLQALVSYGVETVPLRGCGCGQS